MRISCPQCGAGQDRIYYVQTVTEYHVIDEVHEDGYVDLKYHADSIPGEGFTFTCRDCHRSFNMEEATEG